VIFGRRQTWSLLFSSPSHPRRVFLTPSGVLRYLVIISSSFFSSLNKTLCSSTFTCLFFHSLNIQPLPRFLFFVHRYFRSVVIEKSSFHHFAGLASMHGIRDFTPFPWPHFPDQHNTFQTTACAGIFFSAIVIGPLLFRGGMTPPMPLSSDSTFPFVFYLFSRTPTHVASRFLDRVRSYHFGVPPPALYFSPVSHRTA